jgi:adenylate cyclase class 2
MSPSDRELEIKLYISDLPALHQQLIAKGAQQVKPRQHEYNLRFDTPTGDLSSTAQVLRLRQDTVARLTYKGPSEMNSGVRSRREIEFTVSDFEAARNFFEALGYQVRVIYEKYRTTYQLAGVEVTLDELPYGDFAEIEGPDTGAITAVADRLSLDRSASIAASYTMLFDHLHQALGLTFRNLTFENFAGLEVSPADLGVIPADHIN